MNKLVSLTCFLTLVLAIVNLALLLQMGGRMQEIKEKIEPLARSVEQVQPMLEHMPPSPKKGPPLPPESGFEKQAGPDADLLPPPPPFGKK